MPLQVHQQQHHCRQEPPGNVTTTFLSIRGNGPLSDLPAGTDRQPTAAEELEKKQPSFLTDTPQKIACHNPRRAAQNEEGEKNDNDGESNGKECGYEDYDNRRRSDEEAEKDE